MSEANIIYKGTPININEVFPEKPRYRHLVGNQPPRVAKQHVTENKEPFQEIPIELQAQWMANAVIDDTTGAMLE